jgi:hypothetical protein
MSAIQQVYDGFSTKRFPEISENEVAGLEARIRISLPKEYRRYLLAYNGGYFSDPIIDPEGGNCPNEGLSYMCGIGALDGVAELANDTHLSLFDDNDPLTILPIGATATGGLILLNTCRDPDEFGAVGIKIAFGESYYLADSIDEFFGLLQAPPSA